MRVLNNTYREKDAPTDVLSFSQIEGQDLITIDGDCLGDVVISIDTAAKQAKENNLSLDQEVLRLSIHGLLHLLGYDHENVSDAEAQKMFLLEEKLFSRYFQDFETNPL